MKSVPTNWGVIVLGACLLIYPLVFSSAFYLDIGVALLLAAISASAWNIVGGYAGQVSVGHSMFYRLRRLLPAAVLPAVGMAADGGHSGRHRAQHRGGDS